MGLGIFRNIVSNGKAQEQNVFSALKRMPIFGISREGEINIGQNIKDFKTPFSKDFRTAQKHLNQETSGLRDSMSDYANYYNNSNNLTGKNAIKGKNIENEMMSAINSGDQGTIDAVKYKYSMTSNDISRMTNASNLSSSLANGYKNALLAPGRTLKNYMLDGSPLAVAAKGAIGVAAVEKMTGIKPSLTRDNEGNRDISGIPFV